MKSLTPGGRLALFDTGLLAACMAVLGVVMFTVVDHVLIREAEGLLRDEFEEVAVALRKRPLDPEALAEVLEEEVAEHRSVSLAFRVAGADGAEIGRSSSPVWRLPHPAVRVEEQARDARTVRAPGTGERHRVLRRQVPSLSFGPVEVEAALRLTAADAAREDLVEVSVVLAPLLLLFALAAGNTLARSPRPGGGGPAGSMPGSGTGGEPHGQQA